MLRQLSTSTSHQRPVEVRIVGGDEDARWGIGEWAALVGLALSSITLWRILEGRPQAVAVADHEEWGEEPTKRLPKETMQEVVWERRR